MLDVAGKKINFLVDTGATSSVLNSYAGKSLKFYVAFPLSGKYSFETAFIPGPGMWEGSTAPKVAHK